MSMHSPDFQCLPFHPLDRTEYRYSKDDGSCHMDAKGHLIDRPCSASGTSDLQHLATCRSHAHAATAMELFFGSAQVPQPGRQSRVLKRHAVHVLESKTAKTLIVSPLHAQVPQTGRRGRELGHRVVHVQHGRLPHQCKPKSLVYYAGTANRTARRCTRTPRCSQVRVT